MPVRYQHTKPVIGGSSNSKNKEYSSISLSPLLKTFVNEAIPTCGKRSLTDIRSREKGRAAVDKNKRGKGTKIMAVADASGLPVAVYVASASSHEVTLVEQTLKGSVNEIQARLIGDKAYDSDALDQRLQED